MGGALGTAVILGGTIGILGLAGVFSDETQEPLTESQIQQLLLEEDDFPFSGSFNEWESGTGGWLPTDVLGWTAWFPSDDDVEEHYEYDTDEEETDWGACLDESGFDGINVTHEEGDFSSTLASMDHGENLVWVAALDMDTEEVEELFEAQRDKLREGLDD